MSRSSSLSLQRGQSLQLHVRRGTQIVAVRGAIDIVGPAEWLAEQVIRPRIALHEGEAHVAAHGGLIAIESRCDAEVRCIPAEHAVTALVRRLRGAIQRRLSVAVHRSA
jgi:hypothetical protein